MDLQRTTVKGSNSIVNIILGPDTSEVIKIAERRMFAKTIIDSDAFLEMPLSSQLLYFHLGMRADDDGFINKPKTIMKMIGSKDDDIKILISKKFVLPFESGVVVIKHWKIHNYIQNDRYCETKYKEEKQNLSLDENKAYKLVESTCIRNGYNMDTQVRLGKVSLELGKEGLLSTDIDHVPYSDIVNEFNSICISLSKVVSISQSRKKKIKVRWVEIKTIEKMKELFAKVEATQFCKGDNKQGWKATFDWLMENDKNYLKVLEGQYDKKTYDKTSDW